MNAIDTDLVEKYHCKFLEEVSKIPGVTVRPVMDEPKSFYFISGMRCGKTQMMKDLYERLGIDIQKTPNIRCLRKKFDDVDATNAIKEFINKQYGVNSFGRAVPDVCWPTVEQIREEFMMEFLYDGYVRAIDYGFGDDCIDMCVRVFANRNDVKFNFYRRTGCTPAYTVRFAKPIWDERDVCDICREVTNHKLIWQLFVQQNRNFLAKCREKYDAFVNRNSDDKNKYKSVNDFGVGTYITDGVGGYYCITECYLNPERKDGIGVKAHLRAFRKPNAVKNMETWARVLRRYSKEYIQTYYGMEETRLIYYIYGNGMVKIPSFEFVEDNDYPHKAELITDRVDMDNMDISKEMEMLKNYKKEEETKEMDINILKGSFNSKLYMVKNGSEDLSYLGTVMGMSIDRALGCELTGKIDFIADDEPVKKLQYFNREFIKNVVFNDPATIVEWKDGTKTVVQVRDGEKFDPEKGLAMAIAKKAMGNKRDYYHVFKHYLKKAEKASKKNARIIPDTIDVEEAERYKEDK